MEIPLISVMNPNSIETIQIINVFNLVDFNSSQKTQMQSCAITSVFIEELEQFEVIQKNTTDSIWFEVFQMVFQDSNHNEFKEFGVFEVRRIGNV